MLYKIGTTKEVSVLASRLPWPVLEELLRDVTLLDAHYGAERDYLQIGGYSVVAETMEDISGFKAIVDYDAHPCEWAKEVSNYIVALYVLNNDVTIKAYLPVGITPDIIKKELED